MSRKAEVVRFPGRDPRDNQRFVVTNLRHDPERVYEVYRMRGESENRIKEMQHGLRLDLTSYMTFKANQMRVLMTAAAYVLMQTSVLSVALRGLLWVDLGASGLGNPLCRSANVGLRGWGNVTRFPDAIAYHPPSPV